MALISLELAGRHVKANILDEEVAEDIRSKAELASAIVLNYLERADTSWDEDTDPATEQEFAIVQAATLKVFANLWKFRGDDANAPADGPLTSDVRTMLLLVKDHTVA